MKGKTKVEPSTLDGGATGGPSISHSILVVQSVDEEVKVLGLGESGRPEPQLAAAQVSHSQNSVEVSRNTSDTKTSDKLHSFDMFKSTGDLSCSASAYSTRALSASSDSAMDKKKSKRRKSPSNDAPRGAAKIFNFFKRNMPSKRGKIETSVKEISIQPHDDKHKWARRNVEPHSSGSNSRSSSGGTSYRTCQESPNVVVVHDMDNEYNPEYR